MIDTAALRAEQIEKAKAVIKQDNQGFDEPKWIAGADVGFEQDGKITRAAIAVLSYPSWSWWSIASLECPLRFPIFPACFPFVNIQR